MTIDRVEQSESQSTAVGDEFPTTSANDSIKSDVITCGLCRSDPLHCDQSLNYSVTVTDTAVITAIMGGEITVIPQYCCIACFTVGK